ncbi:MAG TPA: hypothetical protein VGB08_08565 [Allosphingosinicella sp.]
MGWRGEILIELLPRPLRLAVTLLLVLVALVLVAGALWYAGSPAAPPVADR